MCPKSQRNTSTQIIFPFLDQSETWSLFLKRKKKKKKKKKDLMILKNVTTEKYAVHIPLMQNSQQVSSSIDML
jgi:hypothetical protein